MQLKTHAAYSLDFEIPPAVGLHTTSAKYTQRYIDQGFNMVMLVNDRFAMMSWVKAEVAKLTGWTPLK